jgi:hypothetical protein
MAAVRGFANESERGRPGEAAAARVAQGPAGALALQRTAGNRATARLLARWASHPDAGQKGVMVSDVVAAEFLRANPPQNA